MNTVAEGLSCFTTHSPQGDGNFYTAQFPQAVQQNGFTTTSPQGDGNYTLHKAACESECVSLLIPRKGTNIHQLHPRTLPPPRPRHPRSCRWNAPETEAALVVPFMYPKDAPSAMFGALLLLPTQHPHHPIQVAHHPFNPQHLHPAQGNQYIERWTCLPLTPLQPTDR